MYIWQSDKWPNFEYDSSRVSEEYQRYLYLKGSADACFSMLDEDARSVFTARTLASEVVGSMEIEGDLIQYDSVFSSIARKLDVEVAKGRDDDRSDSVASVILDAVTNRSPMTVDRLLGWHSLLFRGVPKGFSPKKVGAFREDPVYVVRHNNRMDEVVYEGVPVERIRPEIDSLVSYLSDSSESNCVVKAAIASFWFVMIHPFGDGNGRISRALADYVLSFGDIHSRYYSISSSILKKKKAYYDVLASCQEGTDMDITEWILWFIDTLCASLANAVETCITKTRTTLFMKSIDPADFNSRQIVMLYKLVDGSFVGKLTVEKWMKMAKCPRPTASKDLSDLVNRGILVRVGETRATEYILNQLNY